MYYKLQASFASESFVSETEEIRIKGLDTSAQGLSIPEPEVEFTQITRNQPKKIQYYHL